MERMFQEKKYILKNIVFQKNEKVLKKARKNIKVLIFFSHKNFPIFSKK
jgi:hypothetical protein